MMRHPDFAIIGAGVIGCAIARELAIAGAGRIVVVDAAAPGDGASGAAAGLLAVASSRAPGGVLFALRRASAALFPALVDELLDECGIDVGYSACGLLDLAFSEAEGESLAELVERRRRQGFEAELLDRPALVECEPALSAAVRVAASFPGDRSIDARRLTDGLYASARARGVEFQLASPVTGIEVEDGRVMSVSAGTERLTPGHLVVAAGTGAAEVGRLLGVKLPVRPDRGEMLALRSPVRLHRALSWNDGYLVPRPGAEVLVGATSARGEAEKVVTAGSVALLLGRALGMVPALAGATVERVWAGIRPMSAIRRPIIGSPAGLRNVTLAIGHHRSGVLLAPITARLVNELVLGRPTSLPLGPFCYRPR